jgi:hypothetical protein
MVVAAACLAILGQPFAHAMPGRKDDKEPKLIAKIEQETNPGKKARLQLRLAKLKLEEADQAYRSRNFEDGKALLKQYLDEVRNSWATLQGAGSAMRKHLGALKALEISLRENDRLLEDLRHRVPYPESDFVKEIEKESSEVHNQVLEAIFPGGYTPKGKRKPSPPKSLAPAVPVPAKS